MVKMVALGSAWRPLWNLPTKGRQPPAPSLHSCRCTGTSGTSGPCWTIGDWSLGLSRMNYHYRLEFLMSPWLHCLELTQPRATGTPLLVALASANSLVSSQAPDSRRRVRSASRGFKMFTGVLFLNKAWELWKPSQGSAPSQRFRASLVAEGLKFGILLLEKCCWGSWDAQVMVPATSSTSCDKKWRVACLLSGYCGFSARD